MFGSIHQLPATDNLFSSNSAIISETTQRQSTLDALINRTLVSNSSQQFNIYLIKTQPNSTLEIHAAANTFVITNPKDFDLAHESISRDSNKHNESNETNIKNPIIVVDTITDDKLASYIYNKIPNLLLPMNVASTNIIMFDSITTIPISIIQKFDYYFVSTYDNPAALYSLAACVVSSLDSFIEIYKYLINNYGIMVIKYKNILDGYTLNDIIFWLQITKCNLQTASNSLTIEYTDSNYKLIYNTNDKTCNTTILQILCSHIDKLHEISNNNTMLF